MRASVTLDRRIGRQQNPNASAYKPAQRHKAGRAKSPRCEWPNSARSHRAAWRVECRIRAAMRAADQRLSEPYGRDQGSGIREQDS